MSDDYSPELLRLMALQKGVSELTHGLNSRDPVSRALFLVNALVLDQWFAEDSRCRAARKAEAAC